MPESFNCFKDKRRFKRINVKTEITIYSVGYDLLGKGEIVNVSASGIKFETLISEGIVRLGELRVSFTLPDGPQVNRARGEIRMLTKLPFGWLVHFKFIQPKTVYSIKDYVDTNAAEKTEMTDS